MKDYIDWRKNETSSTQVIGIGLILSVELTNFNSLYDYRAILVSIHKKEKGTAFAHLVSTVAVRPVPEIPRRSSDSLSNRGLIDIVKVAEIAPKSHK